MEHWEIMTGINTYLEENKSKGIKAFKAIIEKARKNAASIVVFSFTYENIEAYVKIDGQFQLYDHLTGVLSQAQLDELTHYKYNDQNVFESYQYWKMQGLVWDLTEAWIVHCFSNAFEALGTDEIDYYWKSNHDDLEILSLKDCNRKLEASEFEWYVKNNQKNLMTLLGQ